MSVLGDFKKMEELLMGTRDVTEEMRLRADRQKLASLCRAALLFHSASSWNDEKHREFNQLTGGMDPHSKGLCEAIREGLRDTGFASWASDA